MAFLPNSRYASIPTVSVKLADGREVTAVKLRRLPPTSGEDLTVEENDRLDIIADRRTDDATRFWHIADANTEIEANDLLTPVGRNIKAPRS